MRLSIIVPALNEAATIERTLLSLARCRELGHEIVLVDGGSTDATVKIAQPLVDKLVRCGAGRAQQMNRGAKLASGEVLWFLHSDTHAPKDVEHIILQGMRISGKSWGRFNVKLSGPNKRLRVVEKMMNVRSKVTGIATGDQGIFVSRGLFDKVGGFPNIPLMEDVALTRKLLRVSRPLCLKDRVVTSSRRWEECGINRTIVTMWALRFAYACGADPSKLSRYYSDKRP